MLLRRRVNDIRSRTERRTISSVTSAANGVPNVLKGSRRSHQRSDQPPGFLTQTCRNLLPPSAALFILSSAVTSAQISAFEISFSLLVRSFCVAVAENSTHCQRGLLTRSLPGHLACEYLVGHRRYLVPTRIQAWSALTASFCSEENGVFSSKLMAVSYALSAPLLPHIGATGSVAFIVAWVFQRREKRPRLPSQSRMPRSAQSRQGALNAPSSLENSPMVPTSSSWSHEHGLPRCCRKQCEHSA